MADPQNNNDFFLGIMVMRSGKWSPHSKFDGGAFGSALSSAEDLDKQADVEAVKVVRIAKSGSGEQKEMWVSPSLQARQKAQEAAKLRAGVQATKETLSAERKAAARK
ncbi:MAG: hypothetical protein H8E36_10815 [Rhodospirillaceae bacterium]|nr:hypothetical protein [Rhodospirillaceae bacterium]MBL6941989.1 hypothetical protein [Rhodospirillales bacterium]